MIYNKSGIPLSDAYLINGNILNTAYDVDGSVVFPDGSGDISKYENYEIAPMSWTAYGGLQGFAYYDGKLVMVTDDDVLKIANAETGALLGQLSATVGHGNGIIFSDEFYDETDMFPLLCWRTAPTKFSYYRITLTESEVVKEYNLEMPSEADTVWYGIGLDGRWLYTIGYTTGAYQYSASNQVILGKYDLQGISNNTVPLVNKIKRNWFECIQGCQFHDGFFWVTSGITSSGHVYAIDLNTAEILLDIPMAEYSTYEIEGCAWKNDYTLIVGLRQAGSNKGMFTVTFPDIQ